MNVANIRLEILCKSLKSSANNYTCIGKSSRIASGCFTSVVVHQDQVYAADCSKNQTQVFQHDDTSEPGWLKIRYIDHDFDYSHNYILALSISNNQLKCCSHEDGTIKVYSLSGELLQTYGTRFIAGQLHGQFITDDDDDGSVLIVDYDNSKLQVMSEQGEFTAIHTQPPVAGPSSAVLFTSNLYVTLANHTRLHRIIKCTC